MKFWRVTKTRKLIFDRRAWVLGVFWDVGRSIDTEGTATYLDVFIYFLPCIALRYRRERRFIINGGAVKY